MSFFVEDTGGDYERCPPGLHLARCYRIVDLGTQKSEYMGQAKFLRKISVTWEVHGTGEDGSAIKMRDGRPYSIFKNYTLSWAEKANLRIDLQKWRGKQFNQEELRRFDLKTLLGVWCMLNIIERPGKTDGKMFSNVDGITPVPSMIKQNGLPEAVNKNEIFNLSEPDMEVFNTFNDKLKEKITASPEWQKMHGTLPKHPTIPKAYLVPKVGVEDDSDIPF